jgi:hypothetical protein
LQGEVHRRRFTSHIRISRRVYGNSITEFLITATKVSRVDEHGIDHQRFRGVVCRKRNADGWGGDKGNISPRDSFTDPVLFLIYNGLVQTEFGTAGLEDELAVSIDLVGQWLPGLIGKHQADASGICSRRDDKIILQLVLLAVVYEVYPQIYSGVFHLHVGRHCRLPPPLVMAYEIIRFGK